MRNEYQKIWEAYENPPMSQGGWSSNEVDRYYGSPEVTDVKVGGSRANDNLSQYPSDQEVAAVVDQFKQLLSGENGGFLRGVTIPAIDNIFDPLVQRWDNMDHMVLFWAQIMQNIGKMGIVLSSYLLDGEPQGQYFNVEYARDLAYHLQNFRKSATEHLGVSGNSASPPAQSKF